MDINKYLDEQVVFIMPNNIKKQILKNVDKLVNIKFYTKDEIKRKLLFDYDQKAIHYLALKYNYKIDICKMYLNNMYYVDDKKYESDKLNNLVAMKKDLLDKGLLTLDNLFLKNIKDKKVIVYGYDYIDRFFKKLLDKISLYTDVEIIKKEKINSPLKKVYEFNDIEEEVSFVASSICKLIDNGVDINNIKLGNISNDYISLIDRIFNFYNIPLCLNNNISIYSTEIGITFLNLFSECNNLQESLDKLLNLYNINEVNNMNIYNKLINICNKYIGLDNIENILIDDLKNTFINDIKLNNAVEIIDLKDNFTLSKKYVFILNFNQGSMPVVYQDIDYISDDIKHEIDIEVTPLKNKIEREVCRNIIEGLDNVVITYKLMSQGEEYYPSSLITDLNLEVIKGAKRDLNISYSEYYDKLLLSKKLDRFSKYDELEDDTGILFYNYQDINYKIYDNQFKGINNEKLINYLKPNLKLSYSSLNDYFECAFRYYVNHIMKLKSKDEAFYLTIGNLFHYILSIAFTSDFDFDNEWSSYLKGLELSSGEEFLLVKLKRELKFVIDVIRKQKKLSTFNKELYEQKIYVNLPNKIDVTFSGYIDKIMYNDDTETKVAIVDYKTGNTEIKLNNIMHGLNMQLPCYLYLISNYKKFNDPVFVGFYLQEILHNEINYDPKKNYEDRKANSLKLSGYTIDEENLIESFDQSYAESRLIKGLKLTKNGFSAYSKLLSRSRMKELIKIVEEKINEASSNILNGKFDVNPKRIDGKNVSCTYCPMRDLCYMRDNNIVTLNTSDNSKVGGDISD
ncbi:MAG TPA: hypothetical protein GX725_02820 [Mollicutes bacterium]|nr:hypothetical protein [Mollicutes bacterium]